MGMYKPPKYLEGPMQHLQSLLHADEADPEWDEAFDTWFAARYPEARWSSSGMNYAWMKHAALSAILWTSGMLPEDDKVFDS